MISNPGFSGDDAPRAVFPNVVGSPKLVGTMVGMGQKDSFVGDECMAKRGILKIEFPIKHGIVWNWDSFERIYHHTFYNELSVSPEEHPVLLTECVLSPKKQKERKCEILFETFNVPGMQICSQPLLAMFASGQLTGVFIEIGGGVSQCMAVYEGHSLYHSCQKVLVGGMDVTMNLINDLNKSQKVNEKMRFKRKEKFIEMNNEISIANVIKEKFCYVSVNYESELKEKCDKKKESTYVLPDGFEVTLKKERFKCTELLFNPELRNSKGIGVPEMVMKCILKCDERIRSELMNSLYLSGKTTFFPGMIKRFGNEMKLLTKQNEKLKGSEVKVIAREERAYSVWIGSSILSSLSWFEKKWMLKDQYDEYGKTKVHDFFLF